MALTYGTQGDGLGAKNQAFVDKLMTEKLAQDTIFDKFATRQKPLGQNVGKQITFRKFVPMRDLLIANDIYKNYTGNDVDNAGQDISIMAGSNLYQNYVLPEGSSGNEAGSMKVVEQSTEVFPIGMWMTVTEETNLFHDMYTISENINQYSEVASIIIDEFYRDTYINSAGHVQDITGGGDGADSVTDSAFSDAVSKISLQLRLSNAKYVSEILTSSTDYGTTPVWSRYIAVVNPMMGEAMRGNADFKSLETYSAGVKPIEGEIGMIKDVRIIENANMLIVDNGDGTYTGDMLIMAKDHTANVPLRGKKRVEVIVKGLNNDDKSDPLNRTQIIGWKSWLGALTLNPERLGLVKAKFTI